MPSSTHSSKQPVKKSRPKVKTFRLVFRAVDRAIFAYTASGVKSVETRAATAKYAPLKKGDICVLVCGKERSVKTVKRVRVFKSITALFKVYPLKKVMPWVKTVTEAEKVYHSFPGYKEKIKKVGLVAFELS
jgi:ASC-1-like (ASCH) protein